MSRQKRRDALGLGFIMAGAVFLFDPFVSVFDLLPDLIGYLLILRGLRELAVLEGHWDEATRLFRRLLLLSALRLLSIPFIFGVTPSSEQPVWLLLAPFTFAILDCIVLFPAWRELALGLTQLAYLHDGHAPLEADTHGVSRTDRLLRVTLLFMTMREGLAVLPEMAVLFSNASGEDTWVRWAFLYQYIGVLRILAAAVVLAFGIVWLVKVARYAWAMRRDEAWFDSLRRSLEGYRELHPDYVRCRAVRRALILLGVAAVLTVDVYIEGINILPTALVGVCVACAAASLRRCVRIPSAPVLGSTVAMVVVGIIATVRQSVILHGFTSGGLLNTDDYSPTRHSALIENANRMLKDADARVDFYSMCGLVLLTQVGLIVLLLVVRQMLVRVIDRYAGPPLVREGDPRMAGAEQEIRNRLKSSVRNVTITGCVLAVLPVIYMVTLPWALGTVLETIGFGGICSIAQAAFAVAYIKVLSDIRRQIDNRYLLD